MWNHHDKCGSEIEIFLLEIAKKITVALAVISRRTKLLPRLASYCGNSMKFKN